MVALWLANTQQDILCLNWDPFKNATIQAQAFAGPTPGNQEFCTFLQKKIGAGLEANYNTLDVVPHAWQAFIPQPPAPALVELNSLYSSCVDEKTVESWQVFVAAGAAILLSAGGGYTTLPGLQAFEGKFNASSKYYDETADPFQNYMSQLGYQHIVGYFDAFNFKVDWARWLAPPTTPSFAPALSQAIDGAQRSNSPKDVVQNLQTRKPDQILVGGARVDAPTGPNDPQAAYVVSLVQTELLKQGGQPGT